LSFTVVCPIHNEAGMLPYTLKSIYDLKPDEVIFSLDRCTDNSDTIIHREALKHPCKTRVLYYFPGDGAGWNYRPGYIRRMAFAMARNDIILNTSADIILDPAIKEAIEAIGDMGLISLGYMDYPYNIQSWIKRVSPLHGNAGLVVLSKRAWLASEDLAELRRQPRIMGEDTHLRQAIKRKYQTRHVNTRSLHLRPTENYRHHYKCGVVNWRLFHQHPLHALAYAVVMLRPGSLAGYVDARRIKK